MPIELTDAGTTFPASVTAPVGGDARTAASVTAGLQDLADRTAYLKNRHLRRVTTSGALTALTDYADGQVAILSNGTLVIPFFFDAASALDPESGYVYRPDDIIGSNPGRWINFIIGQTYLYSVGRRLVGPLPLYSLVEEDTLVVTGADQTIDTVDASYEDLTGMTATFNCEVDDVIHLHGNLQAFGAGSTSPKVVLTVTKPDASTVNVTSKNFTPGLAHGGVIEILSDISILGKWTVLAAGSHTVRVRANKGGGSDWYARKPFGLHYRVLRP